MADIGDGAATCRVKMHRADVRATEVSCEELDGEYFKIDAVLAPETMIGGRDLGGYRFSVPSNTFRFIGSGSAKYASFAMTTARPITLTGEDGDTVEVDGWDLTRAIKAQRERGTSLAASLEANHRDAFSENERRLTEAAMAITESVMRDREAGASEAKAVPATAARETADRRGRPRAMGDAGAIAAAPPRPSEPRNPRAAALSGNRIIEARRLNALADAKHMAEPTPRSAEDADERSRMVDDVIDGRTAADMARDAALTPEEKARKEEFMTAFSRMKTTPKHAAPRARAARPARPVESDSGSARPRTAPTAPGKPTPPDPLDPDMFPVLGIEDLDDQIDCASETERAARLRAGGGTL